MKKDNLKILLMPNNIASRLNQNISILKALGYDVQGLIVNSFKDHSSKENLEIYRAISHQDFSLKSFINTPFAVFKIFKAIYSADIIHWYFGSGSKFVLPFLWWIKFLNKPAVVEFCGTDIRYLETAVSDNVFLKRHHKDIGIRSKEGSKAIQFRFKKYGFEAMTFGYELETYIDNNIFPKIYKTNRCVDLNKLKPSFRMNKVPLIVHIPSKTNVKGTKYIVNAIEKIKKEGLNFHFKMIENILHQQVIEEFTNADIVIDQMIIGDFGTTTVEAMALGKTTICYIKPSVAMKLPKDCPIVNANPDNLAETLKKLLLKPNFLKETGKESRKYIEKYHDANVIVPELIETYQQILKNHG